MYTRILVPLDGSERSESALVHAQGQARASGATIHLAQAVSRSEEFEAMRGSDFNPSISEYERDLGQRLTGARVERAEQYLKAVAERLAGEGLSVETAVLEGSASETIVDYAEEKEIDLIVMSTRGQGGIQRLLVGSVTDRVIRSSHLPVLVVPPE